MIAARALRGFADGFVSVVLAVYLTTLGFSPLQVGAIVTGTLLGSAALTLGTGLVAHRWELRTLLLAACVLMTATGIGFMAVTGFWALMVIAVVGTLNPSAGDVSVFLPDRAGVPGRARHRPRPAAPVRDLQPRGRVRRCVRCARVRAARADRRARSTSGRSTRCAAASSCTSSSRSRCFVVYRRLRREHVATDVATVARKPLAQSRGTVLELAALFSLDAGASGFVVQSLLVLWLHLEWGLSPGVTAAVFFAVGLLERVLPAARRAAGAPHRARPHDGVHPPARQPVPRARRVRADGRRSRSGACWCGRCSRRWTCPRGRRW